MLSGSVQNKENFPLALLIEMAESIRTVSLLFCKKRSLDIGSVFSLTDNHL
jgi:hypothetical protein